MGHIAPLAHHWPPLIKNILFSFVPAPQVSIFGGNPHFMNFRTLLYFLIAQVFVMAMASCGSNGEEGNTGSNDSTKIDTTAAGLAELNSKILNDPNNPDLYHQRAQYYFKKSQDVNAAISDMGRALRIDSTKAPYYLTLSDLLFSINKTGNAKEALEKAIEVDPKNTEAMLKLAELYLFVKKHQESIDHINMALKVDQYNAKAYFMKGMNYKEIGDTVKALSSMETAVEQDPQYYAAYVQLGLLYAAQKNPLAESYYNNALKIKPNSTEVIYNKGKFYQDMRNWNAATATYAQLLQLEPGNKFAHFNMGVVQLALEAYPEALKHFDAAIQIDPLYKEAFYGRGVTYAATGDTKRAASDFGMALQIDPQYAPARNALNGLK